MKKVCQWLNRPSNKLSRNVKKSNYTGADLGILRGGGGGSGSEFFKGGGGGG